MHLAIFSIFAASRSEPLATALGRVHEAFHSAGLGEPAVRFALTDQQPITNPAISAEVKGMQRVSSIARVLKRFPNFAAFARHEPSGAVRALSNLMPTGTVEPVAFATLCEIAAGVPRSFPFHKALFHFAAPGFSEGPEMPETPDARTLSMLMRAGVDIGAGHPTTAGVSVQDAWWVNGRVRSMAALRIVEGDSSARQLPPPPANVAALLAACGKVRKTTQLPIVTAPPPDVPPGQLTGDSASPAGQAIRSIVRSWRDRIPGLLEALPHDLPQSEEVAADADFVTSGPKKAALASAFEPLGYDCRGRTGAFTLRRRTETNLTVELDLDVGTWNNALTAFLRVIALIDGQVLKATLNLPASRSAARHEVRGGVVAGQFPIGGPERWARIVDNLATLVAALDRGFVPEIEAAAGPSPEWFQPTVG